MNPQFAHVPSPFEPGPRRQPPPRSLLSALPSICPQRLLELNTQSDHVLHLEASRGPHGPTSPGGPEGCAKLYPPRPGAPAHAGLFSLRKHTRRGPARDLAVSWAYRTLASCSNQAGVVAPSPRIPPWPCPSTPTLTPSPRCDRFLTLSKCWSDPLSLFTLRGRAAGSSPALARWWPQHGFAGDWVTLPSRSSGSHGCRILPRHVASFTSSPSGPFRPVSSGTRPSPGGARLPRGGDSGPGADGRPLEVAPGGVMGAGAAASGDRHSRVGGAGRLGRRWRRGARGAHLPGGADSRAADAEKLGHTPPEPGSRALPPARPPPGPGKGPNGAGGRGLGGAGPAVPGVLTARDRATSRTLPGSSRLRPAARRRPRPDPGTRAPWVTCALLLPRRRRGPLQGPDPSGFSPSDPAVDRASASTPWARGGGAGLGGHPRTQVCDLAQLAGQSGPGARGPREALGHPGKAKAEGAVWPWEGLPGESRPPQIREPHFGATSISTPGPCSPPLHAPPKPSLSPCAGCAPRSISPAARSRTRSPRLFPSSSPSLGPEPLASAPEVWSYGPRNPATRPSPRPPPPPSSATAVSHYHFDPVSPPPSGPPAPPPPVRSARDPPAPRSPGAPVPGFAEPRSPLPAPPRAPPALIHSTHSQAQPPRQGGGPGGPAGDPEAGMEKKGVPRARRLPGEGALSAQIGLYISGTRRGHPFAAGPTVSPLPGRVSAFSGGSWDHPVSPSCSRRFPTKARPRRPLGVASSRSSPPSPKYSASTLQTFAWVMAST
nr:collagen alpha-1(I) chain-like [Loxodonta africana]